MDPQVKSILTSVAMAIATAVAGWAASHGLIPSGDQSVIANDIVTAVAGLVAAGLAWYKARQVSPKAVIQQVQAQDNGVKVVPADGPGVEVNGPIKGVSK